VSLTWLLIVNDQHLMRVLDVSWITTTATGPTARWPSRRPIRPARPSGSATADGDARVERRDRLGGLIHEYDLAA
jgi:hypothetical protein